MLKRALFTLVLGLSSIAVATGQEDTPDAKDHPEIPRMPGYYRHDGQAQEFSAYEFTLGLDADSNPKLETHEGAYLWVKYLLKEDGAKKASPLQIVRNYENAFVKAGGKVVWKGEVNTAWGEVTFTAPAKKGGGGRWVHLRAFNDGDGYELFVIDEQKMEQKIELSASEMAESLERDGFIALYGIQFDTGKDTIQQTSEALLQEIAKLLAEQSALKLSIEGHTDNVGNAKANQALSERRAAAVKAWLVQHGVNAARMTTQGHGPNVPVGDNRTEDGRAKNRRVELVRKD